ncbi:CPBP family intramembrane glutamic endopeptidase [Fimbriimonas ginsengisoli]|uniref:Putative conserved integral membrane protein n=1 Tax=Fimbriimonas ginsengisoli Gsoil 348 TaxID=661478 RepID=A0A068NPG8_FIMGI|nr:CPBP family intramembrane glutamic endopeptidase [Fimbriimonas ginsengisoli]AIE85272.1 Putative conserved integral membrane protein [Fimbriimonas ginsengisoli Gsoil 348]
MSDLSPVEQSEAEPTRAVRSRWGVEVAVILCVGVFPPLLSALVSHPTEETMPSAQHQWLALLVRSFQVLAPTMYVIWRSREGWSAFGWRRWRLSDDLILGFVLALVGLWCARLGVMVGRSLLGADAAYNPVIQNEFRQAFHVDGWTSALMVAALVANSFAEEVVVRAFLILRFTQLLRSPVKAVLLSSLLFASYHVYQGLAPACGVFAMGLLLGTVYAFQGRVAPLIVAHTLYNLAQSWKF